MIKVFISGPYTAETKEEIDKNIEKAKKAAIRLSKNNFAVFTPHLNTGKFEEEYDNYEFYLKVCREFLLCCDVVLMLPDWENSKGALIEYEDAKYLKKPVFKTEEGLINHYKKENKK